MIKINLLPFRAARTKENIRRQVSIFLLSLIMVTSILIYHNIGLKGKVKKLDKEVEEITVEVASYETKARKVDAIKAKLAILDQKNTVIDNLQMNRYEPVKLLDTMSSAIVADRMWFTQLSEKETVRKATQSQKKPAPGKNQPAVPNTPPQDIVTKTVTLRGLALDNKTIADFMTGLENLPLFSSVRLINIEHEEIRDIKIKKFEIKCEKAPLKQASKGKAKKNANS